MDFQELLVSMVLGAFGGATGGVLGIFISRFTPQSFQQFVVTLFVVFGITGSLFVIQSLAEASFKDGIHAELQKQDMFILIAKEFPDEYNLFLERTSESSDIDRAFEIGWTFTTNLRKENAKHIRAASSEKINLYFDKHAALTRAVAANESEDVCFAFLMEGSSALPNSIQPYMELALDQGQSLLTAIVDGRGQSKARPLPSQDDVEQFMDHWRKAGGTEQMAEQLRNPYDSHSGYCQSYLSFISAIQSWESTAADSMRTELMFQHAIAD